MVGGFGIKAKALNVSQPIPCVVPVINTTLFFHSSPTPNLATTALAVVLPLKP